MSDQEFGTSRLFEASGEEIYAAFRDPLRLARWWGPSGYTNAFEEFDFRPGGSWKFTMHGPGGASFANQSRFVELLPGRRVVIEHLCAPYFTLRIELSPRGSGTHLSWVMTFRTAEDCERVRTYAEAANEQNLDRLAAELRRAP